MDKVEFKYVKNNTEAAAAFDMELVPKYAFLVTLDEGDLWFNGVNLTKK